MPILDAEARNKAIVGNSLAARRVDSVAGVNTSSGVMDWLIPAAPAGYKIVLHRFTGGIVANAASTSVWTFLTGGATVALNTTGCGLYSTATTVTAAYSVPALSEVGPTSGNPLAIGQPGKSLHIHGVITSATAGTVYADYSLVPDQAYIPNV